MRAAQACIAARIDARISGAMICQNGVAIVAKPAECRTAVATVHEEAPDVLANWSIIISRVSVSVYRKSA